MHRALARRIVDLMVNRRIRRLRVRRSLGTVAVCIASLCILVAGGIPVSAEEGASVADQLAQGRAFIAAGDMASARTVYLRVAADEAAPPAARAVAQLAIAGTHLRERQYDAAKAEYAKVSTIADAPASHVAEAQQRIQAIDRIAAGLPPRDPAASRAKLPQWPQAAIELHVAPDGNDAAPGTEDQPLATLEQARDTLRRLKQEGRLAQGGATVYVRGGEYRAAQTFTLVAEDSGTESAPIRYRAAEGDTPVFRGGVRVEGFVPVTDPAILARLPEEARGKVVQADLRQYGISDLKPLRLAGYNSGLGFVTHPVMELFIDGKAMPMSRWPNEGFAQIVDVAVKDGHTIHGMEGSKTGRLIYEGDRPARWKDEPAVVLYGYWFFGWADSYERVASINTDAREFVLEEPYCGYGYRAGAPYYALNLLCEIDMPGEWYLDRTSTILYVYPSSDLSTAVVELSVADYPFVRAEDVSYTSFEGFVWELGGADGVAIQGGSHCLIAGCTVRRCGGDAIVVRGGDSHILLGCDVYSMGRGGLVVAGGDRETLVPGNHLIENCNIYELSRIDHTYTPAVLLNGVGNRIVHNQLHDVASSAMRIEGNDHLIELNEVHHVVQESDDQGGADMWGNATYRGNIFRHNYWHHIGNQVNPHEEPACGQAGIRLDDAISGTQIYGNVFHRASSGRAGFGGVQIHGGKDNEVDSNVFVECRTAVSFSPWGDERWRAFTAEAMNAPAIDPALYVARYPDLAALAENHDVNLVCRNLVVNCEEFLRRHNGRSMILDNVIAGTDALPVSEAGLDLAAIEALLSQNGLAPIPFSEIGLYKSEWRPQLPE